MKVLAATGVIACALVLSSCATQPSASGNDAPGFLWGFVHGFLCLFSLIGSFIWDVRVYGYPNAGRWYDAGFVAGAACFFGAVGHSFEESYVLGYADGKAAARSRDKKSN
jgi:fructose-specific phosphotransferase system IIC component